MGKRLRHLTKEDIQMASKHVESHLTSYVIRELQIKTMRYYHIPIWMIKIQNTNNSKHSWGCRTTGTLIYCWWEWKMVQPLWKAIWQLLTKLNVPLPHDPAIVFLGIYPSELKTRLHKNLYKDVYSSSIHNFQSLEASYLSIQPTVLQ